MFSCKYCGNFKITCFEEYLQTAASIDVILTGSILKHSGFCTTYSSKILFWELKYKTTLKNRESQKKKKKKRLQFLYTVYNVYVMFYYKIPWFYQDFKSENLRFLNLHSVHAAKIRDLSLEVMLSPPK